MFVDIMYISCVRRYMTNRMREEEEGIEIVSEWKFAAMVIDR
jgi:hypothetical protein